VGALAVLGTRKGLIGLVGIYGLYMLAHQALQSTFVLYSEHRYHWDARTVGLMLAAVGACTIVVQGALVRVAVARMGERRTLLLGLTGGTLGFLAYALAGTGAALMASVPVFGLMFFTGPPLQGLMARKVQPNEYGLLQGANASIMGIAGVIGPVLFTQVFAFFLQPHRGLYVPGAPFFLGGALMATRLVAGVERGARGAGVMTRCCSRCWATSRSSSSWACGCRATSAPNRTICSRAEAWAEALP
jgi:DHA1 family tetracycline resistance protein-like MFS transporter